MAIEVDVQFYLIRQDTLANLLRDFKTRPPDEDPMLFLAEIHVNAEDGVQNVAERMHPQAGHSGLIRFTVSEMLEDDDQ